AASPASRDPERLVVAAVVPGRLVVALDPAAVGRPLPRHPRGVRVGLRHPLVAPVPVLPAASGRDDHDARRHHDRALIGAEPLLVAEELLAEVLHVAVTPPRTGERPIGLHRLRAALTGLRDGE